MIDNVKLVDDEHCGPICKIKKGIGKRYQDYRQKKIESMGFTSESEYKKEAEKAREKGRIRAQKEKAASRFKQIQQEAYHKAGGKTGKGPSFIEQFMGAGTKTARTKKRRVTAKPQYTIVSGQAYRIATPKPKARKRKAAPKKRKTKQNDDFFGLNNLKF